MKFYIFTISIINRGKYFCKKITLPVLIKNAIWYCQNFTACWKLLCMISRTPKHCKHGRLNDSDYLKKPFIYTYIKMANKMQNQTWTIYLTQVYRLHVQLKAKTKCIFYHHPRASIVILNSFHNLTDKMNEAHYCQSYNSTACTFS